MSISKRSIAATAAVVVIAGPAAGAWACPAPNSYKQTRHVRTLLHTIHVQAHAPQQVRPRSST